MTAETDLLPCPFCGLDVTDDEGCFPLNRERTCWEVRCGNPSCYAHEPCDDSRQAAVNRWNRRANLAELQREVATWKGLHASEVQVRQRWQARAGRLAHALRLAVNRNGAGLLLSSEQLTEFRAALNPTAAQENGRD